MTRFGPVLILVLALALGVRAEEGSGHASEGASHDAAAGGASHEGAAGGGHGGGHGDMKTFWLMFLVQIVGFLLLVFVLAWFAWPLIRKGMDERREKFAQAYENIRKDTAEVQRLVREFSDKLASIERESKSRMEKAIAEAKALKAEMAAEGQAQAGELAAKAKREIDLETGIALAEVKLEVVERAVASAREALAKGVSADVQRALVNGAIDELGSLREVTIA
ncbi:MAG: ATP synthase F0 subunit B [Planctomycetota bacterium]